MGGVIHAAEDNGAFTLGQTVDILTEHVPGRMSQRLLARTPHGSYVFEIAAVVAENDAPVTLVLREVECDPDVDPTRLLRERIDADISARLRESDALGVLPMNVEADISQLVIEADRPREPMARLLGHGGARPPTQGGGPVTGRGAIAYGHTHAEAFALMKYASEDGTVTEVIWNGRDGVTPFVVTAKDGTTSMSHVDWGKDVYAPQHEPQPGDRIFVDLTPERARESAKRNAAIFWDTYPPSRKQFDSVEELAQVLEKGYLETAGSPDLIEVET